MDGICRNILRNYPTFRLRTWEESNKSGIMGELCRIIRHLGSGIQWAGAFAVRQSKTILARSGEAGLH
jgi:hypothetical protein